MAAAHTVVLPVGRQSAHSTLVFYNEENKKNGICQKYIYKYLMVFFFKLLLLNLLKLMEEIKKLKTNKILGKYTGRGIKESNPSFSRMTNEFAFRGKRGNGREKKIIVLRIVSLLLQSITQSAQERKGTAHHLVPLFL